MKQLDYAIVIATRNRPGALRLSIPRMLCQSRPPKQLIIIDSSDDHQPTADAVLQSLGSHQVEVVIRHSEPSSSAQRNLGLTFVDTPLVFFPDDDSIWFPGTAERQLEVYERDVEGRISAVCAAESATPPPDWEIASENRYAMRRRDRINQRVAALRARIQHTLFPDPAKLLGRSYWPEETAIPAWFSELDAVLVEYMTGFRMSFRTEVIRKSPFDETLNRYGLCEDIDASFGAWEAGLVVGARRAKVFHYKSPEARGDSTLMGVIQVLNKAYVVVKRTKPGDQFRGALQRFVRSKAIISRLTSRSSSSRRCLAGIKAAMEQWGPLIRSERATAGDCYRAAFARALATSRH